MLFCSNIHSSSILVPKWPATSRLVIVTERRNLEFNTNTSEVFFERPKVFLASCKDSLSNNVCALFLSAFPFILLWEESGRKLSQTGIRVLEVTEIDMEL